MLLYGLCDGVARRDYLVAAAVYGPEDYSRLYPGADVEAYKDYLLKLENFLEYEVEGPARVERVPFDLAAYRAWLERYPHWRDGAEARGAWALAVAEDPEELRRLRAKKPVLPRAPVEEETDEFVLFAVLFTGLESFEEVKILAERFSEEETRALVEALREALPAVPEFTRLSPLRARGVRVVVGSRLVLPHQADEVAGILRSNLLRGIKKDTTVFILPRWCRVRHADFRDANFPVLVPLLAVVGCCGASGDLRCWEDAVEDQMGEFAVFERAFQRLVEKKLGREEVVLSAALVPEYVLEDFLEAWMREVEEEEPEEEGPGPGGRRRGLHRVK